MNKYLRLFSVLVLVVSATSLVAFSLSSDEIVNTDNFIMTVDKPVTEGIEGGEVFLELGETAVFTGDIISDLIPLYNDDESPNIITFSGSGDILDCGFSEGAVQTCEAKRLGSVKVYFDIYGTEMDENGDRDRYVTNPINVIVGGRTSCVDFEGTIKGIYEGFEYNYVQNGFNTVEQGNPFEVGTAVYESEKSKDYCVDENTLFEYSCQESGLKGEEFECANGCFEGACNPEEGVTLPDFVVEDVKIEPYDCAKCGESKADYGVLIPAYHVYARIHNVGNTYDENSTKIARVTFSNGAELVQSQGDEVFGLEPNSYASTALTSAADYPWTRMGWIKQSELSEDVVLTVEIDPGNIVEELNEINNSFSRTVELALKPQSFYSFGNPFFDMDEDSEVGKAAIYLYEKDMVDGNPDGSFAPEDFLNRAAVVKMLNRAKSDNFVPEVAGETGFSDVSTTVWYAKDVVQAVKYGYISGYPDGTFGGGNVVNVAEFSKMLALAFELEVDASVEGGWWMQYFEALEGYDLDFLDLDPSKGMTRGEVAIAIYQFLN